MIIILRCSYPPHMADNPVLCIDGVKERVAVSAFTITGYKQAGINAPQSYSQLRILYPNTYTSSFNSRWLCSVILSLVSLLLKQLLLSLLGIDRNIHPNTTFIFFFSLRSF